MLVIRYLCCIPMSCCHLLEIKSHTDRIISCFEQIFFVTIHCLCSICFMLSEISPNWSRVNFQNWDQASKGKCSETEMALCLLFSSTIASSLPLWPGPHRIKNFNHGIFDPGILGVVSGFSSLLHLLVKSNHFHQSSMYVENEQNSISMRIQLVIYNGELYTTYI